MKRTVLAVIGLASLGAALAAGDSSKPTPHPMEAELLDPVRRLAGTWDHYDDKGTKVATSIFTVTAEGNAVRELLFPGEKHEMTNMYHMDGASLVMTHYCSGGTQPRMRATALEGGALAFRFESVGNLLEPDQSYMGEMTLVIKDANNVQQQWTSFAGSRRTSWTFSMKRQGGAG